MGFSLSFGAIAVVFALRVLSLFAQTEKLRKSGLKVHLEKMTGAQYGSYHSVFSE